MVEIMHEKERVADYYLYLSVTHTGAGQFSRALQFRDSCLIMP